MDALNFTISTKWADPQISQTAQSGGFVLRG